MLRKLFDVFSGNAFDAGVLIDALSIACVLDGGIEGTSKFQTSLFSQAINGATVMQC